eukprot:s265_g21.t1
MLQPYISSCAFNGFHAHLIQSARSRSHFRLSAGLRNSFVGVVLAVTQLDTSNFPPFGCLEMARWRRQRRTPEPEPPQFLEDAAALRRFHHLSAAKRHNETLTQLLALPPEDRAKALATMRAKAVEEEMRAEGKCEKCMMQKQYCICESIETIRNKSQDELNRWNMRFVVWMHHKERRRASNTGKLLKLLMPDKTDILVHGVAEDDQLLKELIQDSRNHCFVVYPSEDAVPLATLFQRTGESQTAQGDQVAEIVPVAVLIDGTWNQAQRMHKHFEAMQHVVVFPAGQSKFHWRRQSQEGRISTVEAAALVLEELGQSGAFRSGASSGDAGDALRKALDILMDALGRQCHHDTLFNHELPEPTGKKKFALGAKKIQKILPGQRGSSSICDDDLG